MSPATTGRPASEAYHAATPWRPLPALAVAIAASFAPVLLWLIGLALLGPAAPVSGGDTMSQSGLPPISEPSVLAQMAAGQMLSFLIIWMAAGWRGARRTTLQLARPQAGWLISAALGLLMIALIVPIEVLMYKAAGLDLFTDSRWLLEGLRSPLWWGVALVAVVLAPLWEEVTFRGFLLSALAQTRLGFWPSAAITSLIWTVLHMNYSRPGLASVFLAGMGLSWIMKRTGSLRAVVVAHGVINAFSLSVVYLFAP